MVKNKKEKDNIIGKKLRQLRNMRGISQSILATESGVTFQQIQKYEKGVNRISAGRLHDFSKILNVDVNTFYNEVDEELPSAKKYSLGEKDSDKFVSESVMDSRETINLIREYYKIKDPSKRKSIIDFIKAMGDGEK